MLPVLLTCLSSALALTSVQGGPSIELGAGLGLGERPITPAVGAELGVGWWIGRFDDQFSFGRYWLVQGVGRLDARGPDLSLAPMVELRRGLDLLVAGLSMGVGGGPLVAIPAEGGASSPGWTARASVGGRFRRSRALSVTLRLEGGADVVGGETGFGGAALLGGSFLRPVHRIRPPDPSG